MFKKTQLSTIKSYISDKLRKEFIHMTIIFMITVGIFFLILKNISFSQVLEQIATVDIRYFVLSLVFFVLTVFFFMLRWYLFLKQSGLTSKKNAINSFMLALPFNVIFPSKLGDFVRVFHYPTRLRTKFMGSIIVERIMDIFILLFSILIFSFITKGGFIIPAVVTILFFSIGIVVLYTIEKIPLINRITILIKASKAARYYFSKKIFTLTIFIVSLLAWFSSYGQIYYIFLSLGIDVSFGIFMIGMTIATFISMIPITVAGMGTRETALLYFFSNYASQETLLAAGLLTSFFRYWLLALIGLPFLVFLFYRSNNKVLNKTKTTK